MLCKIERDPDSGEITFDCDEEGRTLQSFLETDLQEDLTHTEYLLILCRSENNLNVESTGNSYSLLLNRNNFKIESLYDSREVIEGRRSYLLEILENWKASLSNI